MHVKLRRTLIVSAFIVTLIFFARAPADAEAIPGPLEQLQQRLTLLSTRAPGHIGVLVKDLTTGLTTGINETANMPAASTIKIPVMVEVFRQIAVGDFDLNRRVTLERTDLDDGWGDLVYARPGTRFGISRLLQLMITESDNTATNMLIRLVGRVHINQTMAHLGLRETRLGDYIRSNGDIRGLRTSPRDMSELLDRMAHDRLINAWSSRAMIAILTGQHHNGLLPEPLPPGTQIAHKTGTLHDTLNDVGIVYLNDEPYIIAVMTTELPTLDAGRRFIRGVSRLAYDSLEKFALWREANPLSGFAAGAPPSDAAAPDVKRWLPPDTGAAAAPLPEPVPAALPLPVPAASPDDVPLPPTSPVPASPDPEPQATP
jgi:beta-lactamase class A